MELCKLYRKKIEDKSKILPVINIKNVQIGTRLIVGDPIDLYLLLMTGKSNTGRIGTVISKVDCSDRCREYRRKNCGAHLLNVKLSNSEINISSCGYKFTTLQGNRVVSEGEYLYGGNWGPIQ